MVAIPLLLYHEPLFGLDCQWLGTVLIYVAAVLTVVSMLYYLRKALAIRLGADKRRVDRAIPRAYNRPLQTRE